MTLASSGLLLSLLADFSQVKARGKFYLEVSGVGHSIDFEIGDNVYDIAFYTIMRGLYLWRCGTAVKIVWEMLKSYWPAESVHLLTTFSFTSWIEGRR